MGDWGEIKKHDEWFKGELGNLETGEMKKGLTKREEEEQKKGGEPSKQKASKKRHRKIEGR